MYKIARLFFLLIFIPQPLTAGPEEVRQQLQKSSRHQVIQVIDGDTVILEDKSRVRLVGLQAPRLSLGRKGFRPWPLGKAAKDMLSALTLNKFVTLYYGGQRRDRYGRLLAHLFLDNGIWVQGELLGGGMARVYSFADNRAVIPEMMVREQDARSDRRGIWALDYYKPKDQATAERYRNSFQLVTGTVASVAKVRGTYYLNFGEDWREDFTIVIKSRAARKFIKANTPPADYQGKKLEVRGWLKSYNGPMIEATHPEQIMIIE